MKIEAFELTKDDYAPLADLMNAVYTDNLSTPDEMEYFENSREAKCKSYKWRLKVGDEWAGFGEIRNVSDFYHPDKYWLNMVVHPDHRNRGYGQALWGAIEAKARELDAIKLRTAVKEDWEYALRFCDKQGMVEMFRGWESALDLQNLDPTPILAQAEKARQSGIAIKSLAELRSDPDRDRKTYEVSVETEMDAPSIEPITKISFETFVEHTFKNPNFIEEAFFIALDGDRYVGTTAMWLTQGHPERVYTGLTGVLRDYRRRGIASALKLRGLEWAKNAGYKETVTWNATINRPMLSINEALGFEKRPAWVEYHYIMREEACRSSA